MQRKPWCSILGSDAMPLSLKNLLLIGPLSNNSSPSYVNVKVQKRVIDNVSASIGIMSFLKQVLILACIFASCNSQGAPWSEEETAIIYKKVEKTINFSTSGMVRNRYLQLHPEAPNYHPKTNPNPPKVMKFS